MMVLTLGIISAMAATVTILFPAAPTKISMAVGLPGSAAFFYAQRYKEKFAASGVTLDLIPTTGGVDSLNMISDANSRVRIALITGGVMDKNTHSDIASLGSAYNAGIWIFTREGAEDVQTLSQFKGKRIAAGPERSATREIATRILAQFGVTPRNANFLAIPTKDVYAAWVRGEIDVVWAVGGPSGELTPRFLRDASARIVSFPMADAFVQINPHLVKLPLRKGIIDFEAIIPSDDVTILGTQARVLVRKDIHPEMVSLLLQVMSSEHSGATVLQKAGEFPRGIDIEFPIADGVIDFYKNGPSYFQRHLPLWLTPYVQRSLALLIALLALLLPALNYGPRTYRWIIRQRFIGAYRRLRFVDTGMKTATTTDEVSKLQNEIETLDREVARLNIPNRQSDLHFGFKVHVNLVRTRLASRLAEINIGIAKG